MVLTMIGPRVFDVVSPHESSLSAQPSARGESTGSWFETRPTKGRKSMSRALLSAFPAGPDQ